MFEIIEPVVGAVERYRAVLPNDGRFAIRFHHLGFFEAGVGEVDRLEKTMRASEHPIPWGAHFGGSAYFYADALDRLGHHLEYFFLEPEYAASIPRHSSSDVRQASTGAGT